MNLNLVPMTVPTAAVARRAVVTLISMGCYYTVDPLPHDQWQLSVKPEFAAQFQAWLDAEGVPQLTRQIEMFVGTLDNRWTTQLIDIPAATPEAFIHTVADRVMQAQLEREGAQAAFLGVYHIPEPEPTLSGDRESPLLDDLEALLSITELLKNQLSPEAVATWRAISARVADRRDGTDV